MSKGIAPVSHILTARRRKWIEHPTFRFISIVSILFALYWGYGYLTGPGRMTARLSARLNANPTEVNVAVTTKFPPEEFHISIYQRIGSMRSVKENTAYLHTVTPANVRYLSQFYWIDTIDLIPEKN